MTSPAENLATQVRFESSLAHLANALTGRPDDANVRATDDVDRLLDTIGHRAAA
jgi:hypothetical protein